MASEDIVLRIKALMDTGDVSGAVKELQNAFGRLNLTGDIKGDFDKVFKDLIKSAETFENRVKGSFESLSDINGLKKSRKEFDNLFNSMIKNIKALSTQDAEDIFEFDLSGIKKINEELQNLENKAKQTAAAAMDIQKVEKTLKDLKNMTSKTEGFNILGDLKEGNIDSALMKFEELQGILKNFGKGSDSAKLQINNFLEALKSGDINAINEKLEELTKNITTIGKGNTGNLLFFADGLKDISIEIQKAISATKDLDQEMDKLRAERIDEITNQTAHYAKNLDVAADAAHELQRSFKGVGDSAEIAAQDMRQLNSEVEEVKNRVKYFLSLENAVDLFRRGVQKAFETVKELDKAMTETAVVTDFSVGDMWEQLPMYTQMANDLGVSTQGVYEASTLYYQQGLQTEQVMALTAETLKMARIAGLDYAEATNLMTAALRGFNMEINETSAQRVNDIYSELAAITAADTNEIATAMTKTASIANNANMELETTAALLAQMIETTREPAETAGTAMKTIVARFTEMKKAVGDVVTVEGEEVNVNKVDAALASVGVSLKNAKGEFRDLDDVFLDLAKKWNSLDIMSQRYVATTAAGSRQQSRFIAMMQDYDRTIELVDAAYNSAGASAAQFAKTQESVETKVNNLKNAWNEFLMGVANSSFIKVGITILTELLNVLNNLTSGSGEATSSLLKIITAIGMFKTVKTIFNQAMNNIGATFLAGGKQAGTNFQEGMSSTLSNAKNKFPLFGTLKKQIRKFNKEIKGMAEEGRISLEKLSEPLSKQPKVTTLLADDIGQSLQTEIFNQLNQIGDLTPEGQQWAQELIKGFVQKLKAGKITVAEGMQEIEKAIQSQVVTSSGTKMVGPDGKPVQKEEINTAVFEEEKLKTQNVEEVKNTSFTPKATIKEADLRKTTSLINDYSAALMGIGMVASSIGGELEELGGTAGKAGSVISVLGNSASTTGMLLMGAESAAKLFGKSLSSLGMGPLAAITAVVSVIMVAVNAWNKYKETQKEAREASITAAVDSENEVSANRELATSLEETIQGYKEGVSSREDVSSAAQSLIEKYGLESQRVQLLTGDYEKLTEAIRNKRIEEEKNNLSTQSAGALSAEEQLKEDGIEKISQLNVGMSLSDEIDISLNDFSKKFQQILEDTELEGKIQLDQSGSLKFTKDLSQFSQRELVNLYTLLNRYIVELSNELKAQDKTPEDSEVYLNLSKIINNTKTSFENLQSTVDGATNSLMNIAGLSLEEEQDITDIQNRESYTSTRERYTEILANISPGLTKEEIQEIADQYFSSISSTGSFVEAEEYKLKLETKFGSSSAAALEIYQKYINGEISPEEFVSLMVEVDIESANNIEDIEEEIEKNKIQQVISAPEKFNNAFKEIGNYISENFTIEGIEEDVLTDFENQLKVINGTLPNNINLLDEWNYALSQGTIGITSFATRIQSLLEEQNLLMQTSALNYSVYGLSGTDEEIQQDIKDWETLDDTKKTEVAKKYGLTNSGQFEDAMALYNMDTEAQEQTLEANLKKAQQDYDNHISSKSQDFADIENLQTGIQELDTKIEELQNKKQRAEDWKNTTKNVMDTAYLKPEDYGTYNNVLKYYEDLEKDYQEQINKVTAEKAEKEHEKRKIEYQLELETSPFESELNKAQTALDNFKEKAAIKEQLEINVAIRNAEQLGNLRAQLEQLQSLTKDGMKVDLSTFKQMQAITPNIAKGVKVLADGTLDVSAGMKEVNAELQKQLNLSGKVTKATLADARADEKAYQTKIQKAIDAIDAEIAAMEAGNGVIQSNKEATEEALTQVTSEGAHKRATLAEEESQDMSTAAQQGATNVINTVSSMDEAYKVLGNTLDQIHAKMQNLGKGNYKTGIDNGTLTFESAREKNTIDLTPTIDETVYTTEDVEGWISDPTKMETTDAAKRKAQLEATKAELEKLYNNSVVREGDLAVYESYMLGGGTETDGSGGSAAEKENVEKLTALQQELNDLKEREREIDDAIKDLMDDEIVDMGRVNNLLKQREAIQKQYINKLKEEQQVRQEAVNIKWKEAQDQGYDKYIDYDEEGQIYSLNDEFYELFEDGISVNPELTQKIMNTVEDLNGTLDSVYTTEREIQRLVGQDKAKANETYNAERGLTGVERRQAEADMEEQLIGQIPIEQVQGPLKMLNLLDNMAIEYDEIQYTNTLMDNKQEEIDIMYQGLTEEQRRALLFDEYEGYTINSEAISEMYAGDPEGEAIFRKDMETIIKGLNDKYDEWYALFETVSGGKLQKALQKASKATEDFGKELKLTGKTTDAMKEAIDGLDIDDRLKDPLKKVASRFTDVIDSSDVLNKEFKSLGAVSDKTIQKLGEFGASEEMQGFLSKTLGEGSLGGGQGGKNPLKSILGDGAASIGQIGQMGAGLLSGDMIGMLLNGAGMGMDMFGQMKDMASQMIQYVVQFVTTVINWWINREDWLYNLLSAIEQEVHNFNRQEQVEERFRLYSDEGLDDLVSAWEAMRQSLEKQIDLNEQLIKSRQAELQFLNLTNLPFSPAFYYDYTEERVIENPWVYDIYVLLLDLGAMIPEIGQIFSSIKQLMEDNKKRMEDGVKEIEDAREEILELEKKQLELRTKYMEDEIELEELVMDTIIEKQQEEIDELSAMNDAISAGNEKLIETLNSNLDRIRQQRENEKTEEELGEKERRLAYLRQDTSNANRAQIMDLKEELEDERRSYTDELIDQKISALEEQNELAAEQRQKQIELLQGQLDYTEKYGLQWAEAQTLIKNGFDSEGRLRVGSELFDMLMSKEDFTSMGNGSTRQVQQIMDWNVTSIAAAAFREINDIWEEGFGNFKMSSDVHDQSRLHLWDDREVDYYELPSWLSFLQPAVNTIQDYLWRTGTNIETFIDTSFLSGKNSSSILGKTIVPLLQELVGLIKGSVAERNKTSEADGVVQITDPGYIGENTQSIGYSWIERFTNSIGDSLVTMGDNIVSAFTKNNKSNTQTTQKVTETNIDNHPNFYITIDGGDPDSLVGVIQDSAYNGNYANVVGEY